jgi:hypothetical protein
VAHVDDLIKGRKPTGLSGDHPAVCSSPSPMPMTRRQEITNRSKAKSQNARKRGPTPSFPANSNTLSSQLPPISQADLHSSRTTMRFYLKTGYSTHLNYRIEDP